MMKTDDALHFLFSQIRRIPKFCDCLVRSYCQSNAMMRTNVKKKTRFCASGEINTRSRTKVYLFLDQWSVYHRIQHLQNVKKMGLTLGRFCSNNENEDTSESTENPKPQTSSFKRINVQDIYRSRWLLYRLYRT